ncbi:MAG: nicotinate-nucleotide adenylyltransferase [Pseudomonadota bacterium]
MRPIGILGGTFDPIHQGHLAIATQALQLGLESIFFVPVNIPPHRDKPLANELNRKKMVELAIQNIDNFFLDCREIERNDVSYSIDTIKSFRADYKELPLCMILGKDAFNQIDSWHQWDALLDYAHIIVADRVNNKQKINNNIDKWLRKHLTDSYETLERYSCGRIFFMPTTLNNMSSSFIRDAISKDDNLADFLHPSTIDFIRRQHLYQETK